MSLHGFSEDACAVKVHNLLRGEIQFFHSHFTSRSHLSQNHWLLEYQLLQAPWKWQAAQLHHLWEACVQDVSHGAQSGSQEVQPHTCSIFGGDGSDWDGPREEAYPQVKWSYCMDGELLWAVSYILFYACMEACYLLSMFNQCWFYGADSNQCVFLTQSGRFSTWQTGNPPSQLLDQAKTAYEDV